MSTPEDWGAMEPYQDAITARTLEYHALANAASYLDSAVRALDDVSGAANVVHRQALRRCRGEIQQAADAARLAMDDAGARATVKWAELNGQHGSTRFVQ